MEITKEIAKTNVITGLQENVVEQEPIGTIRFRLFDHVAPSACRNFRQLATGQPGFGYKDSNFFRIVPDFLMQGGKIESNQCENGTSIYDRVYPGE